MQINGLLSKCKIQKFNSEILCLHIRTIKYCVKKTIIWMLARVPYIINYSTWYCGHKLQKWSSTTILPKKNIWQKWSTKKWAKTMWTSVYYSCAAQSSNEDYKWKHGRRILTSRTTVSASPSSFIVEFP